MRRAVRAVSAAHVLTLLLLAPGAEAALFPIYTAPLRVPQVPVVGNTLQQRLDGFAEQIVVTAGQVEGELFASTTSPNSTYSAQVELTQQANGIESGLYNGHDANPTLMLMFSADAHSGSFAVVSYRNSPTRAVVTRFNENAELLGTTTWLGADRNAIGVYAKGPQGIFYSEDSRNPGTGARWLCFPGTGLNAGCCWLAAETSSLTAAGGEYDDVLWFLEGFPAVTPVARTSWGELKSRFR